MTTFKVFLRTRTSAPVRIEIDAETPEEAAQIARERYVDCWIDKIKRAKG